MSSTGLVERLEFVLPDFTRQSWVDEKARGVWEPRLRRIVRAWADIEWASVLSGVRACMVCQLPLEAMIASASRWAAHGLSTLPLNVEGIQESGYASTPPESKPGKPAALRVVVGALPHVVKFKKAWDRKDHVEMGALLGYPTCCRNFFQRVWVEGGSLDTTWGMAVGTVQPSPLDNVLEVAGPPMANILWRWMGVRAVPHLPCSFDCAPTVQMGERLLEVANRAGYAVEMDWMGQILSWPVEWSALHGIAEIKTPVLKVSTRTDATPHKYVVRWKGRAYPEEGVQGLTFPYKTPARTLVTESSEYQRGLDNLIKLQPVRPEWYHLDNGFNSRHAMDKLHRPLVDLARAQLKGVRGNVFDLGCGNGALLEKICRGNDGLVPYGVDYRRAGLDHVGEVMPEFRRNFGLGDLYNPELWSGPRTYEMAILMVGRLLEVPKEKAGKLLELITSRCRQLLVYVYSIPKNESFESLAGRAGLRIQEGCDSNAGIVVLEARD